MATTASTGSITASGQDAMHEQRGQRISTSEPATMYKNGKRREITPELARKIRLPHFKPPVKLGSHEDVTPAGGFITRVWAGQDGLDGDINTTSAESRR